MGCCQSKVSSDDADIIEKVDDRKLLDRILTKKAFPDTSTSNDLLISQINGWRQYCEVANEKRMYWVNIETGQKTWECPFGPETVTSSKVDEVQPQAKVSKPEETPETMEQSKEETHTEKENYAKLDFWKVAAEKDDAFFKNPDFFTVFISFLGTYSPSGVKTYAEKRIYRFYVPRSTPVLKCLVDDLVRDFYLDENDVKFFNEKAHLVSKDDSILDLPMNTKYNAPVLYLLHSVGRNKPHSTAYRNMILEPNNQENIPKLPEVSYNLFGFFKAHQALKIAYENKNFHAEKKKLLLENQDITETLKAKTSSISVVEKALIGVMTDFSTMAQAIATKFVEKLSNVEQYSFLYPNSSRVFVAMGVQVRELRDWFYFHKNLANRQEIIEEYNYEMYLKCAQNEIRARNMVNMALTDIISPLLTIVSVKGMKFVVENEYFSSIDNPIQPLSLAYGSYTNGVIILNSSDDLYVQNAVRALGKRLNLSPQLELEKFTGRETEMFLPMNINIYTAKNENSICYYIPNASCLLVNVDISDPSYTTQYFRPEFVQAYSADEYAAPYESKLRDGFQHYMSIKNVTCSDCKNRISEKQYYIYQKRNHICCLKCYDQMVLNEDQFQYLPKKFNLHTILQKFQLQYWYNELTDEVALEKPVCQTSLLPNASTETIREIDKDLLRTAKSDLYEKRIPAFIDLLNDKKITPFDSQELVSELHNNGIGVGCLGLIVEKCKLEHIRQFAVVDILLRCFKSIIYNKTAGIIYANSPDPVNIRLEKLHEIIVTYLNVMLSSNKASLGEIGVEFWETITTKSIRRFHCEITAETVHGIHKMGIIIAFCQHFQVSLKDREYNFTDSSIIEIEDLTFVCRIQLEKLKFHLIKELQTLAETSHVQEENGLIWDGMKKKPITIFKIALSAAQTVYGPESVEVANLNISLAELYEYYHASKGTSELSKWNNCANLEEDNYSSLSKSYTLEAIKVYQKISVSHSRLPKCHTILARLSKDPNNFVNCMNREPLEPPEVENVEDEGEKSFDHCESISYLQKAIKILETRFGIVHPEVADTYMDIAGAFLDLNEVNHASEFYRKAFCSYANVFDLSDELTINCCNELRKVELKLMSGLENVPIEDLEQEIEKLEFGSDTSSEC